ncbi:MAG: hypothetical protein HY078_03640 [Elusimicrobia bacterium]|nr:hypothetical protein [Elusimicrobiota bacterium]
MNKRFLLSVTLAAAPLSAGAQDVACPRGLGTGLASLQVCRSANTLLIVTRLGEHYPSAIDAVIPAAGDRGEVTGLIRQAFGDRIPEGSPKLQTIDEHAPAGAIRGWFGDDPQALRAALIDLLEGKENNPALYKSVVFRYIKTPSRPRL